MFHRLMVTEMEQPPIDGRSQKRVFCFAIAIGSYDGKTLEAYLQVFNGQSSFPIFRGLEPFVELQEKGLLQPHWSMIRLLSEDGGYDGHYEVTDTFQLEGMSAERHEGVEGVHDPVTILTKETRWEAQKLRRA